MGALRKSFPEALFSFQNHKKGCCYYEFMACYQSLNLHTHFLWRSLHCFQRNFSTTLRVGNSLSSFKKLYVILPSTFQFNKVLLNNVCWTKRIKALEVRRGVFLVIVLFVTGSKLLILDWKTMIIVLNIVDTLFSLKHVAFYIFTV